MTDLAKLKEQVDAFNTLSLPGQPMMMHMGTSQLVSDLWREIERLRAELAAAMRVVEAARELPRGREFW